MRRVIAFDGHDACGKTTLGRAVAEALGAAFTSPYPPGSGARLVRLWRQGRHSELAELAVDLLRGFEEAHAENAVVVCDRHTVSAMALLPDAYHDRLKLPDVTVVCSADLPDVIAREAARGQALRPEELPEQRLLLERYRHLAERHRLYTADSSTWSVSELTEQVLLLLDATSGRAAAGRQIP
ncbi:hypothetical protein QQY24_06155 [Streptomyces sp. TG1A-8]|uniref:hypothetical protein n=1 Tax=Streptomyces sp. TG1A-8 TaxID=3051385 RepID=UPI00265BFCCF|nr:hypothetical protein [Streptomyces sp. TG1A-8]MDO0925018.1 hypothetical protein [Streptomyces sp. TG1A-8]